MKENFPAERIEAWRPLWNDLCEKFPFQELSRYDKAKNMIQKYFSDNGKQSKQFLYSKSIFKTKILQGLIFCLLGNMLTTIKKIHIQWKKFNIVQGNYIISYIVLLHSMGWQCNMPEGRQKIWFWNEVSTD